MKVIRLPKLNPRQRIGGKARIRMEMLGCSLVSRSSFCYFFGMETDACGFIFLANYVEVVEAQE